MEFLDKVENGKLLHGKDSIYNSHLSFLFDLQ